MTQKSQKNPAEKPGPKLVHKIQHMANLGQKAQAFKLLTQGLIQKPDWNEGWPLLYTTLLPDWHGRMIDFCEELLLSSTKSAVTPCRMAEFFFNLEAYDDAADLFSLATQRNPRLALAWRNLGVTHGMRGDEIAATQAFLHAYQLEPSDANTSLNLESLLSRKPNYEIGGLPRTELLNTVLSSLLTNPNIDHQKLAPLAFEIVADLYEASEGDLLEIQGEHAFPHTCLRRLINVNLRLEPYLVAERHQFLLKTVAGSATKLDYRLGVTLALACFNNEFVWYEMPEETELLKGLEVQLENPLVESLICPMLAYSMYRPLHCHSQAETMVKFRSRSPDISMFLQRRLVEPLLERELAAKVPAMTPIEDPVSHQVRQMYEESPFPRWFQASGRRFSFEERFKNVLKLPLPKHFRGACQVLIAGCGTGQHPIGLALGNPQAKFKAVDLSRASLAYAMRKQRELKLKNLSFGQADILQLDQIGETYQHIESVGVLHHMAEPLAGWRVLKGLLQPGGTMRIGLYSELGRAAVVKARSLIAAEGIPSDPLSVVRFRARLLNTPEYASLLNSLMNLDFFSTSTLRDLIFHVQEHRYDLTRLGRELDQLGLTFLGFEVPTEVQRAFEDRHPQPEACRDLTLWEDFERAFPQTFRNMYVFWAQSTESN